MVHCQIKFLNNPHGIYQSGQTITGCVELGLEKPKRLEGFVLKVKGTAESAWTDYEGRHSIKYERKEKLLRSETSLINTNDGVAELPSGLHVYNFSCLLPSSLPTSFKSKQGHITYCVTATIIRSWKFNQAFEVAFTVLNNVVPSIQTPLLQSVATVEHRKTYFGSFRTGFMAVKVQLPVTGYFAGEMINLNISFRDTSNVNVREIITKLYQVEKYICYTNQSEIRKKIAKVQTMVSLDNTDHYTQQLKVPHVIPTTKCAVLELNYEVIIKVWLGYFQKNPRLRIPIVIGPRNHSSIE